MPLTDNFTNYIRYGRDINIENLTLDEGEFAFNIETGVLYGGGLNGTKFIINPTAYLTSLDDIKLALQNKIGSDGGTIDGILVIKGGLQANSAKIDNLILDDYQIYVKENLDENSAHILNYASFIFRQGKRLFLDEEFYYDTNNIIPFNTANSDSVTIVKKIDSTAPNNTNYVLHVATDVNYPVSPNLGGVRQSFTYGYNKRFVTIFKAKLGKGYEFCINKNEIGVGGNAYFISSNKGTGKWESYIVLWSCGHSGNLTTGGDIYVKGPNEINVEWDICSYTTFDTTNVCGPTEDDAVVLSKPTYLDFPNVGKKNVLYLDIAENEIYRWDDVNLHYRRVGSDYHDIEMIYGGNAG